MEPIAKDIIRKYDLVVYPLSIFVAINCDDALLETTFSESIPSLDDKLLGYVCELQCGILIRFRGEEYMSAQYIAHEATHAALDVYAHCGCRVDTNNQEPYAFLVDCIADFCTKTTKNQ